MVEKKSAGRKTFSTMQNQKSGMFHACHRDDRYSPIRISCADFLSWWRLACRAAGLIVRPQVARPSVRPSFELGGEFIIHSLNFHLLNLSEGVGSHLEPLRLPSSDSFAPAACRPVPEIPGSLPRFPAAIWGSRFRQPFS